MNTQVVDFMSIKQSKISDRSFGIYTNRFQKNRQFNNKNRLRIPVAESDYVESPKLKSSYTNTRDKPTDDSPFTVERL